MIIETGFIVFLSLMVIVWRLPRSWVLWLLGHPLWLEAPFGLLAYALHYGTYSGMMAAAVAVIMCYIFVQCARGLIGYTNGRGKFTPGVLTRRV
jgi:hypothetical protein